MNSRAQASPDVLTVNACEREPAGINGAERNSPLRVLALVPGIADTRPAQRFRIEQWAPLLRSLGVQIEFEPFESPELNAILYRHGKRGKKAGLLFEALLRRAKCMKHLSEFDLVYVLRETALLGPAMFERWMKVKKVPFVFDFDDAIFLPNSSEANRAFGFLKFPGKTAAACRLAAHVMAGNDYLAEYARQFNRHVTVVPTTIDTTKYRPAFRSRGSTPVIGWSGSRTTGKHLELAAGPLRQLAKRRRFRMRVIGVDGFRIDGLECEAMPWKRESEVEDLRALDIGIMPLPDDRWSRGKCGLKALQYMALGIPTVCSPVGVNADIVSHGHNGFLASSESEWVEVLEQLIDDDSLGRRVGCAGLKLVEQTYSCQSQVPRIAELLRSAAMRSRTVQA